MASSIARRAFASATFSSYDRSTEDLIQSTSAAAEKLGPSPARTTARARPTATNASASSAISPASNALRRSGRASVIRRTSPSRSVRRFEGTGRELRVLAMLRGALAAAVTPLRDGGFDRAAVAPYVEFLAGHGLDGVLVLGTTGEGVLFSPDERREIAIAFVEAAQGQLQVAVHRGAQATRETVAL